MALEQYIARELKSDIKLLIKKVIETQADEFIAMSKMGIH